MNLSRSHHRWFCVVPGGDERRKTPLVLALLRVSTLVVMLAGCGVDPVSGQEGATVLNGPAEGGKAEGSPGGELDPSQAGRSDSSPSPPEAPQEVPSTTRQNEAPAQRSDVKRLSQLPWNRRFAELSAELDRAADSGNQILERRKAEALRSFLKSTLQEGRALDGWIGRCEGVEVGSLEDEQGRQIEVLRVVLKDACEFPIVALNYDPVAKRSTGMEQVFEQLSRGDAVRISGSILSAPSETNTTYQSRFEQTPQGVADSMRSAIQWVLDPVNTTMFVTLSHIERPRLHEERADHLDRVERLARVVIEIFRKQDEIAKAKRSDEETFTLRTSPQKEARKRYQPVLSRDRLEELFEQLRACWGDLDQLLLDEDDLKSRFEAIDTEVTGAVERVRRMYAQMMPGRRSDNRISPDQLRRLLKPREHWDFNELLDLNFGDPFRFPQPDSAAWPPDEFHLDYRGHGPPGGVMPNGL